MAGISNNLYPPSMSTYMPAFLRTQVCRVYFSLSPYNSIDEIMNAQVSISNQKTNVSALSSTLYPAAIKITSISTDTSITTDEKYYIEINPSDLTSGIFELNQYYKVQIRFTATGAGTPPSGTQIASWLINNQAYFSEWSRVCLIKGIETPTITITGLAESSQTVLSSEVVDFVGTMSYSANSDSEKEYLKSYNIKLYSKNDLNTALCDSGTIYTDTYASNEINYTLTYQLKEGEVYRAILTYTTNNNYTGSKYYDFLVIASTISKLNATISAEPDNEDGRMAVYIRGKDTSSFSGVITIRRSSHKTGFTVWEDMANVPISATILSHIWYDNTVESGVWYKYCAQKRDASGNRGIIIQTETPAMIVLEDSYLLYKKQQLKLKFDPAIDSYQITTTESLTNTIGGKYPFIRRNGNTYYKQFSIGGLISCFSDENNLFTSKAKLYNGYEELYANYNQENKISEYYDFVYERAFREAAIDFLYGDNVFLFRSPTEGNLLIKLMNISLTPQSTLGRMVYSFSATAYEIAEATMDNMIDYNVKMLESEAFLING